MKSKTVRFIKGKIAKVRNLDGCWNCIEYFDDPRNACSDCEDYSEWMAIDHNPYDYSMSEVYDNWNWYDDGDDW